MQTVLGAGGAIGRILASELYNYTDRVRLVSRKPQKVKAENELFSADLTNAKQVLKSVEGSDVVYLTVGLPYDYHIWKETWPQIMSHVIEACKHHNARLVFFDNVYMYDRDFLNPMTEKTPVRPTSRKGQIRKQLADMLFEEIEAGRIEAIIARSADFYGPSVKGTSVLTETVIKNLAAGKKANWMGKADCIHSFTYVPDAGKATALLGNTDDTYNQVWHLPTTPNPPTGKEWIEMFALELGVRPRYRELPLWMLRMAGVFSTMMKELWEMAYQYDRDYNFDSTKFFKRFKDFESTSYRDGVKEIVQRDYANT